MATGPEPVVTYPKFLILSVHIYDSEVYPDRNGDWFSLPQVQATFGSGPDLVSSWMSVQGPGPVYPCCRTTAS